MEQTQFLIRPSRDKKPYRLKCRFKTDPSPSREWLERAKVRMAERFVADMGKQGWVYDDRFGFKMTGPYPVITPVEIHVPRRLTAREMLSGVSQGDRFLDQGGTMAVDMPKLEEGNHWEYELAGVFIRDEILVERPDPHEERY